MIGGVRIRFNQVLETWKAGGFTSVVRKTFCKDKEIIIAQKDLSSFNPFTIPIEREAVKFIAIDGKQGQTDGFFYGLRSRYLKKIKNLNKGYKGFALVKGDEIVGDVWYCDCRRSLGAGYHPDLKRLGIQLGENEVYLFDLYIKPEERGGGLVNFMLRNVLAALKGKGFVKAYGYYRTDNVPALWVHRTFGYREVSRLRLRNFHFFHTKSSRNGPTA